MSQKKSLLDFRVSGFDRLECINEIQISMLESVDWDWGNRDNSLTRDRVHCIVNMFWKSMMWIICDVMKQNVSVGNYRVHDDTILIQLWITELCDCILPDPPDFLAYASGGACPDIIEECVHGGLWKCFHGNLYAGPATHHVPSYTISFTW